MKLAAYVSQLAAALRSAERVTEVTIDENKLPYDTVRVTVSYGEGRRAKCFVSAEKTESYESLEDGDDLERFTRVMA